MRHTPWHAALVTLSLSLTGCFDTHGRDDLVDAGPLPGDGGWVIRDCAEASFASEGAPCDFEGSCVGGGTDCGPPTTIQCIEGRVRILRPICTRAPVRDCMEYLSWSYPGDFCLEPEFMGCTIDVGGCCTRRIVCVGSAIADETVCVDDCGTEVCPGYAPPPPELPGCTSSLECEGGIPCVPAGSPPGCGICREPVRECESDADCGVAGTCVETSAPCSCGGPDSACAPDCRTAESDPCGEGSRCGTDGHCRPISCLDGHSCPANMRCTEDGPSPPDGHGCSRIACSVASDCDCGVCMDGLCQDGPGVCMPPVG